MNLRLHNAGTVTGEKASGEGRGVTVRSGRCQRNKPAMQARKLLRIHTADHNRLQSTLQLKDVQWKNFFS